MLELVLVSIGVFALVLFAFNVSRSLGTPEQDGRLLDGSPKWEDGLIISVESGERYLSLTSARIAVEVAGRRHTVFGLLPQRYETQIVAGASVSGHVEYDELDTLRTHLWDAAPDIVLRGVVERLGQETESAVEENSAWLRFPSGSGEVWVFLPDDGWLTIEYTPAHPYGDDDELLLVLRSDWEDSSGELVLVGDQLAALAEDVVKPAEAAFLERLDAASIRQIEQFTLATEGWVSVMGESIEFECALPFAEPELILSLIEECVRIATTVETSPGQGDEVAGDEVAGDEPDGHW